MGREMRLRDPSVAGAGIHNALIVLIVFVLLAVAMTWPLSWHIDELLVGDDYDVYVNMWANWWTREAISQGLDFYNTDYILFPQGTSLAFFSFSHANTALWLLLAPAIGRVAAYNVPMLLAYTLSGFSMYLLVHHLTHSRCAGFIAGLVFAFCPYHMYESAHPNLAAVQWMPLFVLSLHRMLYDKEANRFWQPLLGALWFLLTALSGWHLMLLLAGWTTVYLLYEYCTNRGAWVSAASRRLILLVGLVALSLIPFVWPIARDYLTTDTTFATVEIQEGLGNDLLAFLVPHQRHPVLGSFFARIHDEIGYARRRPAYLGWAAIGLAVGGVIAARRRSHVWLLAGLVFGVLSLGLQIKASGKALLPFHLPWAVPIIKVLRHPYRLNTLVFLSLAVLVGYGAKHLSRRIALRGRLLAGAGSALLSCVLLLEYLVRPFPTTEPLRSPFAQQLAEERGDFAVADFPMGRQPDKHYMFYQTTHGKKIVGGFVSRAPDDAYAFVSGDPLLGPLLAGKAPDPALHTQKQLASLASHGIRYIILHQRLLDDAERQAWRERLTNFPTPFYEDSGLVAYRTLPRLQVENIPLETGHRTDVRLGDHIRLLGYRLDPGDLSGGGTLEVTLFWQSDGESSKSYHVFVHLVDEQGQLVAQHDGIPMWGELPTWSWWKGEVIQDEHSLVLDESLPDGEYALYTGMYDVVTGIRAPTVTSTGESPPDDAVLLEDIDLDRR
jgi:hypothetical protein